MSDSNHQSRPALSMTVRPSDDGDRENLQRALNDLAQQNLSVKIDATSDSEVFVLSGWNEESLETTCSRILHEYNIALDLGELRVTYLETIRKPAEAEGKYIRQAGSSGNYGHCKIRLSPGDGSQFINEIKNSATPDKFIAAIDEGIRAALEGGLLSGHPVVDVTVTLLDCSYHHADSNEMAYRIAGSIAVKEAAKKASPVLLEPIVSVEAAVSEVHISVVVGDLNNRRGRIVDIAHGAGLPIIRAVVPLAEMIGYARWLASATQGPARSSIQFLRYQPATRSDDFGLDGAGVAAIRPSDPKPRSSSATAHQDAGFEPF